MRNFWDFAWSYPDVALFRAFDVDAASYTGAARASRSYYDALRAQGTNVLGIQETTNERAQQGYQAGVYDVQFARRRWAEVGFGPEAEMAYAVSDGSRDNPTWNGDAIADYGQAVGDTETGRYKFYGNRYAVDHACVGAARSRRPDLCMNLVGGWVPRTWNFDPSRDTAAQEVGSTPIGGIDVNTTYKPVFGGGAPTPEPEKPKPRDEESAVKVVDWNGDGSAVSHVWASNGVVKARGFNQGAPGAIIDVPVEGQPNPAVVAPGNPEPLVTPASAYGKAQVWFPSADGREVVVIATAYGPLARLV